MFYITCSGGLQANVLSYQYHGMPWAKCNKTRHIYQPNIQI